MEENLRYSLWVGDEEIMQAGSIDRLKTEIEWQYEDYDDAIIIDNETNKVVYENEVPTGYVDPRYLDDNKGLDED